jgi:hypothetical protein
MPSSGMLRRIGLVRTDVLEEFIASIIRVERVIELGTTLILNSVMFLRNVASYKSYTASHPRIRHSS